MRDAGLRAEGVKEDGGRGGVDCAGEQGGRLQELDLLVWLMCPRVGRRNRLSP